REVNLAAMREARIDADVMRNHPFSWALSVEIEEAKRSAREAQEALQAARAQLAAIPHEVPSVLEAMRRQLSPTPVGRTWRLAKRMRHKLSPTPVGRTYRFGKRVVRAGLAWVGAAVSGRDLATAPGGAGATPGHPTRVAEPPPAVAPPDGREA